MVKPKLPSWFLKEWIEKGYGGGDKGMGCGVANEDNTVPSLSRFGSTLLSRLRRKYTDTQVLAVVPPLGFEDTQPPTLNASDADIET